MKFQLSEHFCKYFPSLSTTLDSKTKGLRHTSDPAIPPTCETFDIIEGQLETVLGLELNCNR